MPITRYDAYATVLSNQRGLSVPIGGNAKPGDLRVVRVQTTSSRFFPSTQQGWTRDSDPAAASGGVSRRITFFVKVIEENEPALWCEFDGTGNTNGSVLAVTLAGADASAARVYGYAGSNSSPSNRAVTAPPVEASRAGVLLTYHDVTRVDGTANAGAWGAPADMTALASSLSDSGNGYNVLLAAMERTGSGATGARTASAPGTGAVRDWSAVSLFVPEAVAAPAGPEPGRMMLAA